MLPLAKLHGLADARGDGLRPELLDLLRQREERLVSNSVVVEIHADRQAGPAPMKRLGVEIPENVVRFRLPIGAGERRGAR